tara:strand:- start:6293 stop:7594 length:1302 start_codon:yes stop_codon:yes gene_type:complete
LNQYIKKNYLNFKFTKQLINNYFSFGSQVLLGFFITIIIISKFGTDQLGVFTQTYALFVIFSQLAVFGLNESVLKKVSISKINNQENILIINAIIAAILNGIIFSFIIFIFSNSISMIFDSNSLKESNQYIFIAIFFITLNKVMISIIQAKKLFNLYAFLNALRPFLIFSILVVMIYLEKKNSYGLIFAFSEIILFLLILILFNIKKYLITNNVNLDCIKSHYYFSSKVFLNSFFSESFIRIDILMIGFLLDDIQVGFYSLAALFFEGLYQFSIVIRNIINPDLAILYFEKKYNELINLIKYFCLISFIIIILSSIVIYNLFPLLFFLIDFNIIQESHYLLKFLLIGLVFYSLVIPCENLLFQSNNPFWQSIYMLTLTIINIVLNYIFIKKYGLVGAAIATAMVYSISFIIFNFFVISVTDLNRGIYIQIKQK